MLGHRVNSRQLLILWRQKEAEPGEEYSEESVWQGQVMAPSDSGCLFQFKCSLVQGNRPAAPDGEDYCSRWREQHVHYLLPQHRQELGERGAAGQGAEMSSH